MGNLTKPIAYPSQDILRFVFPADTIPVWTVTNTSGTDETINVPAYSNSALANALSLYIADIPVQEAAEAAEEQAEAAVMATLLQNNAALPPSLITGAGRHYIRSNRWYTGADDQYGYAYYQHSEQAGSGAIPTMEWEHMGIFLPAGRRLGNIHIVGRTNSTSVTDIRMFMALRYPDSPTRWETGYDNDSEMDYTLVHDDMFANPSVGTPFSGGNMADTRRRTIALDQPVDQDSYFSIYMKSSASNTSTRYFYHTWTLEVY